MSMCYPAETDWSCEYTEEQLTTMRADPATLRQMQLSEARAWYTLASLCAYRIGVCETVVRPCAAGCGSLGSWMEAPVGAASTAGLGVRTIGGIYTPYVSGGIWINGCGCRPADCSCTSLSEVILPGPVGGIDYVMVDGVMLPKTAYRVDNGNRLVRQDGQPWPSCQDMGTPIVKPVTYEPVTITFPAGTTVALSREGDAVTAVVTNAQLTEYVYLPLPAQFHPGGETPIYLGMVGPSAQIQVNEVEDLGELGILASATGLTPVTGPSTFTWAADPAPLDPQAGTFAVSYYRGAAPNDLTRAAAGALAVEFYKACTKAKGCRLPKSVQRVTRGNTTYEIDTKLFPEGYTRIEEVDAVIRIYNPYTLKSPPRVLSPDDAAPRRTTWGY